MGQVIAHIENKRYRDDHSHQYGENQWEAVETIGCPKGLEILTVVFLHHYGPEKRRDEHDCEQSAHGIRPPQRQNSPDKWQEEGEHQSDGCR